jgi:hypothetical protein
VLSIYRQDRKIREIREIREAKAGLSFVTCHLFSQHYEWRVVCYSKQAKSWRRVYVGGRIRRTLLRND